MQLSMLRYVCAFVRLEQNKTKCVGVVKSRSAYEDWEEVGFNPWSSGRDPLAVQFIASLSGKQDELIKGKQNPDGADIGLNLVDRDGAEQAVTLQARANTEAEQLAQLMSWTRHGKYREIEEQLHSPDLTLDIDARDEAGNTLLMIAAQNGNKRIAKLCLRRGAQINLQNVRESCFALFSLLPPLFLCYNALFPFRVLFVILAEWPNSSALRIQLWFRRAG
jgi:ankyrin repeat protein